MHDGEYEASIDAFIYANDCVPVSMQEPDHFLLMDSNIRFDDDPIRASLSCVNVCFEEDLMKERTQHADRAELYIGLFKESVRKDTRGTHSTMKLWCYCVERRAAISNLTAKNMFQLKGQTPHSMTLSEPVYI